MIESVHFRNFKVLRDTTLPLAPFTLIVGPNGSGKTTALQAFQAANHPYSFTFQRLSTVGLQEVPNMLVEITLFWGKTQAHVKTRFRWNIQEMFAPIHEDPQGRSPGTKLQQLLNHKLGRIRIYSLDANAIAATVQLQPQMELSHSGANLAGVLDRLRDHHPERFEALNDELRRWLPEFDRILFDTPKSGSRVILLRTSEGHHAIEATDLSQGTLLALAILTLAYLPDPPSIVCFEEPDRSIHPRLLRDVRDALYRLSYPESFAEKRDAVQVVATTHSPYFLDLFKERPEEIVIAHKTGLEARFERLSDRPDIAEVLGEAPLGEVWYSGILGGGPPDR